MRLAVSNIAWPAGANEEALALLKEGGAEGVELALTKVWPEPLTATEPEVTRYRHWWEERGLRVVALQALLFGKPNLALFGPPEAREAALDYLKRIIDRAAWLGAGALVFGSPGNRRRGTRSPEEAMTMAAPFFRELGDHAAARGVAFCIEPNPPEYGCDFVTRADHGAALVDQVNSPGFGLHLDTAAMHLAGDGPERIVEAVGRIRHFHASAPHLGGVPGDGVDYAGFARALRKIAYTGWVSIEMAEGKLGPSWRQGVARALEHVRQVICGDFAEKAQRNGLN